MCSATQIVMMRHKEYQLHYNLLALTTIRTMISRSRELNVKRAANFPLINPNFIFIKRDPTWHSKASWVILLWIVFFHAHPLAVKQHIYLLHGYYTIDHQWNPLAVCLLQSSQQLEHHSNCRNLGKWYSQGLINLAQIFSLLALW